MQFSQACSFLAHLSLKTVLIHSLQDVTKQTIPINTDWVMQTTHTTLHHFISISLDEQQSITSHIMWPAERLWKQGLHCVYRQQDIRIQDWKLVKLCLLHTKLSIATCSRISLNCLWAYIVTIVGEPGFNMIQRKPPVTWWCNNLSLAGKQPVQIKSLNSIFRGCARFHSVGHIISRFANGTLTWILFLQLRHYSRLVVVTAGEALCLRRSAFSSRSHNLWISNTARSLTMKCGFMRP